MRRSFVLAACGLVLGAASARATVRLEPVKAHLVASLRPAAAGKAYSGLLEIVAARAAEVSNLRFEGKGWSGSVVDAAPSLRLEKQAPIQLVFAATPSDPESPLVLVYDVDGKTFRTTLDLSTRSIARAMRPGVLVEAPVGAPRTARRVEAPMRRPEPLAPRPQKPGVAHTDDDNRGPVIQRTVRVFGRIAYTRSDGQVIGADGATVAVYDEDDIYDDFLAMQASDHDGYFDIDVPTGNSGETNPDLYVDVEASNSKLQVQTATWETNYSWRTGTWDNYSGSSLDLGTRYPDEDAAALAILTNIIHAWRWLLEYEGYDMPTTDAQYPDDSTYYSQYWEEIHIAGSDKWNEGPQVHEYGHHWVKNFAFMTEPQYCNGLCDGGPGCGHCWWCQENPQDAYGEGFPDWMGDLIPNTFGTIYGTAALNPYNWEGIGTCSATGGNVDSPDSTEGFIAALLVDIADSAQDSHPEFPGFVDDLSLGTNEIFDVAGIDEPSTPADFLYNFKVRFPQHREKLWETAKNCGFEIDMQNPGVVTDLGSPSHTVNGAASPDATIEYVWTRATDDCSGVDGYGIFITDRAAMPSATMDIGDVVRYTTAPLAPGVYYFNIRTVDHSGKWSSTYASVGPITIRAFLPMNLAYYGRAGWADVLVPRASNDATLGSVPAPTTLPGNSSGTWWNVSGRNTGDDPTGAGFQVWALVDGGFRMYGSWGGSLAAMGSFYMINLGPLNISGGRHTFGAGIDGAEELAESNEVDNAWAHQWIWTPYTLTAGTQVTRARPPDRAGGISSIVDGSSKLYNCDGLRFTASGNWNAVWVYASDDANDYDCRMHTASTGATNGFGSYIGWSSRAAGCLDAVIVNRSVGGMGPWDVGVINYGTFDPLATGYRAKLVTSQSFVFGDSLVVTMPQDEMLLLREFRIEPGNVGPVSIDIAVDPAQGPMHIRWFSDTFATGDLNDYDAQAVTDAAGRARIDFTAAQAGYNCLAIFRDPKEAAGAAAKIAGGRVREAASVIPPRVTAFPAIDVVVEIEATPPDFEPYPAAGWYAPFVPRPAHDGTAVSVPAPATLAGNAAATYFNYAVENSSPAAAAAGMLSRTGVDGVLQWPISWGSFTANGTRTLNSASARTVGGGRHTVSMRLDSDALLEEIDETDNVYGEQWVWSPLGLALGAPVTRAAPADRTGGWSDITLADARWYNCDGLRTPVFTSSGSDGYWGAVAVMPGAASDVDVRIHEIVSGVKDGFASSLALSGWGPGQSDFVLVDFRLTGFRAFDAGVLQTSGAETYRAEVATSTYRADQPQPINGPYTLAADRIVDLHEFTLQAGAYEIRIENVSGTLDWGVSLHGGTTSYHSKSDVVTGGAAWMQDAGLDERMFVDVPFAGNYCLAVWKAHASDLAASGTYRIHFLQGVTDVAREPLHAATALGSISPSPFGPSTTVAMDLASTRDVRLEVFDVAGTRVRTLAAGPRPGGRHRVTWDGRDDAGRRVASGVYFVRMVSGRYHAMQKVVVLR